ncbi:MAG: MerR family transcriptional regulator [Ilumatobacteraceae bacterium]
MTVGQLAQRLRVSPRALRHYESVGVLRPAHVDPRTGYRYYGDAELARGLQLEQLKAAGLSLTSIGRVLDDAMPLAEALEAHRSHLREAIDEHRRALDVVDAMLGAPDRFTVPVLVDVPAVHALGGESSCAPADLAGAVRRLVQRLRRTAVQRLGVTPSAFSARFTLEPSTEVVVKVAAHLGGPCGESVVIDGVHAVAVDVVGVHALLAVAQDAAVAEALSRGLTPCGWIWEHYLDIGPLPRTRVLVPVVTSR